jgi:hypothetical protein
MAIKLIVALLLVVPVTGCVVSFTNPLPASQQLSRDERLLGRWTASDEQGNPYWIRFEKRSDAEITVSLPERLGYHNPLFRVSTTKVSDREYMILRMDDPNANKDYMVVRYSINGVTLKVCPLNVDRVKEAISKRKLKGRIEYTLWGGAAITESPKRVLDFLNSRDSEVMFTCLPEFNKASN